MTARINYLEFPSQDLAATKAFFSEVLDWQFTDYGPDYTAFAAKEAGIDGGFYRSDTPARVATGSALVVLYTAQLEALQDRVIAAGGKVSTPIFAFPGGRRFHFIAPGGCELAAWSE
ncbi:VOC family protein [Ferrimonas marina]|uniref:VOC domain-containing protein n=1 Tax=Ferrimonas marina TaxID=299255 RepID=A0A1M5MHD1_9GAMM|nr:VOC family protein [Ferrimonas marina]SHG76601.1 hypothetical protein SAMN02745129_0644 [Ferrimonas marina]